MERIGDSIVIVDRAYVYTSGEDFFERNGSAIMKLTPAAAIDVCRKAAGRGLLVIRIEGGILHHPGFEARLDCIWDSKIEVPTSMESAEYSNSIGSEFIKSESVVHDAFIITVKQIRS